MADDIRIELEFLPARPAQDGTPTWAAPAVVASPPPRWLADAVVACLVAVPASCAAFGWVAGSAAGGSAPLGALAGFAVGASGTLAALLLAGISRES